MIEDRLFACAICGELNPNPVQWFLVTEDRLEDKLKILAWNKNLARHENIHLACNPSHVQELVVHWMATGSVHHPFAQGADPEAEMSPERIGYEPASHVDVRGVRTIGELTVHRESMRRVLRENPESLRSLLHALHGALQQYVPTIHDSGGVAGARATR